MKLGTVPICEKYNQNFKFRKKKFGPWKFKHIGDFPKNRSGRFYRNCLVDTSLVALRYFHLAFRNRLAIFHGQKFCFWQKLSRTDFTGQWRWTIWAKKCHFWPTTDRKVVIQIVVVTLRPRRYRQKKANEIWPRMVQLYLA